MSNHADFAGSVLLLCAHGVEGGPGIAGEHARRIGESGPFRAAHAACLSGQPSLADCLDRVSDGPVIIVPFLMSDGYTARSRLPRALESAGTRDRAWIAPPVGTSALLPALAERAVRDGAARKSWPLDDCSILVTAHGTSRDPRSAGTAYALANALARVGAGGAGAGFLDQDPKIADAARNLPANRIVAIGLFADEGPHGRDDVLHKIGTSGRPFTYCGALGVDPDIAKAIIDVAGSARPYDPKLFDQDTVAART